MFPAINISKSGTRKEELLLTTEELNRVFLLRNFLGDMPETEAIEFLLKQMNRSKKGMTLNPTKPEGRAVVARLVKTADVVIANLPFQTLKEMCVWRSSCRILQRL